MGYDLRTYFTSLLPLPMLILKFLVDLNFHTIGEGVRDSTPWHKVINLSRFLCSILTMSTSKEYDLLQVAYFVNSKDDKLLVGDQLIE
jgi:hypothetical protein